MAEYRAASDVFVGKASPSPVYEALSVGRPVIATGYAGLNELGVARHIAREGLGCYVSSAANLAREVRRYAADSVLFREVARRCGALNLASKAERFAHHIVGQGENRF
jgi:hypothetical protein